MSDQKTPQDPPEPFQHNPYDHPWVKLNLKRLLVTSIAYWPYKLRNALYWMVLNAKLAGLTLDELWEVVDQAEKDVRSMEVEIRSESSR